MLNRIEYRTWVDEAQDPRVESLYECEFGIIHSKPRYHGGGWPAIENACYEEALDKYKELLRQNNSLIEAQEN